MNKFISMRGWQFAAGAALLLMFNVAQAQYIWIDAKGVKQFSDQAPPGSIPTKNILKAPGKATMADMAAEAAPAAEAAAGAPVAKTVADREADYRKRMKEKADVDGKAADAAAKTAQKSANCAAGRAKSAQLATGRRVRSSETGGYLDETARAAQQANANQALAECN